MKHSMFKFAHRVAAATTAYTAPVISSDPVLFVGGISRSGTTLLTTVLDAHPSIVMGAEMIPSNLPRLESLRNILEIISSTPDLKRDPQAPVEVNAVRRFFSYCKRGGILPEEIQAALSDPTWPQAGTITLEDRMRAAWLTMRQRWLRDKTRYFGFKLNSSAIQPVAAMFPNSRFLCMVRDPRDVVESQIKRKFQRSLEEMAQGWDLYASSYRQFAAKAPDRCRIIRYEDLVRAPRRILFDALTGIGIEPHESMLEYYKSDSSIHESHHPNAERLRVNFSTSSLGTGRRKLSADQLSVVERKCHAEISSLGYTTPSLSSPIRDIPGIPATDKALRSGADLKISALKALAKRTEFLTKGKRKYESSRYAEILSEYASHSCMTLAEYVRLEDQGDDKVLLIRHDIDHDIENAIKIAEWEHNNGFRSTFCILHTAWYYGEFNGQGYRHSDLLLRSVDRILELGHEINLHNNLAVLSLQTGCDPFAVLESELAYFDRRGIPIVGTSTHGDGLCRELNFRNWEIFTECCDDRFGGPRTIQHEAAGGRRELRLGERSMSDFGLEYEAYDIARDVYTTDSGGNLRVRQQLKGRRNFGRTPGRGETIGVLTHPIWWKF